MKDAAIYSLKIWITAMLLIPLVSFLTDSMVIWVPRVGLGYLINLPGYIYFAIKFGLGLYLICLFVLFVSAWLVNRLPQKTEVKKGVLTILYTILLLLPQFLIGHWRWTGRTIEKDAIWSVITIGCIWFYKLRQTPSPDSEDG